MKRIIVLCLLAICFPSESFSEGIFGLKKGMSIEEIRALDFGAIRQDSDDLEWWIANESKKPKDVSQIRFFLTPKDGLLRVLFIWSIQTNAFGDSVNRKFNELHGILAKKYGKGKKYDSLDSILLSDPEYWMIGLLKRKRRLDWFQRDFDDTNKWNLRAIGLTTKALSTEEALLFLDYEFQGMSEYISKEASQF